MKNYKVKIPKLSLVREKSDYHKVKIQQSADAYNYIKQFYHTDISIYESFYLLLVNKANNTIGYVKISQGGVAGTVVDIIIIAKYAIESLASGVIIAHNHPSGTTKPSQHDIKITNDLKQALTLFKIQLHDHIILTEQEYFSFADEGLL